MKCNNCGAELTEGTKFCGSCGTAVQIPVEQPIAEPEQIDSPVTETTEVKDRTKKVSPLAVIGAKIKPLTEKAKPIVEKCKPFVLKNKLWFAGGACLLVLLITALIIISACTSGNGFTAVEHNIQAFVNSENEVMIRYDNSKIIKTGIESTTIRSARSSIDGSVYVFMTTDNQLVVVKNKKVAVVAEDVAEYALSINGNGIAYVTKDEEENCELFLYNVSKKKSTRVISEYIENDKVSTTYDISPDGKSVAYYKYNEDDDTFTLMYFNGSKHTKITSGEVSLVGLSNKGKYIYAYTTDEENNNTLYCYNSDGDKQKLGNCSGNAFAFNEDHTQILFYEGTFSLMDSIKVKTYISTKGKEPVRISSNYATPLVPNSSSISIARYTDYFGDISEYFDDYNEYMTLLSYFSTRTIPCKDLFNKVYLCDKDGQTNAWLIKKNVDKSSKLVSDISSDAVLDESAEYLYYTDKDDTLMVLKISHGDNASDKAKQIAEDVDAFVVTSDRSRVYFTSDNSLYSCNGKNGKSKKTVASEGVSNRLVLNAKDVCFYNVEGDVYATNNGKKGKMVVAEAEMWTVSPNGIVCIYTEDALFVSKTNKKPTKIYETN